MVKEDASAIQAQKAASTPAAGGNADEEGPEDWPEYSEDLKDQMLKHAASLLEDGYSTEDVVWLHAADVFLEALVDEVQLQIWVYEEEVTLPISGLCQAVRIPLVATATRITWEALPHHKLPLQLQAG